MFEAASYRANAHYFQGCGPSILSSLNYRRRAPVQKPKEPEATETVGSSILKLTSDIQKPVRKLEISPADVAIDKPEPKVVFQEPPPQPKKDQKIRNLSPATLGQMLTAELDHFLKVEQDIAAVAEVETNIETARHEHKVANEIVLDDDTEELEELQRLDAEIARLEAILEKKAAEYYSDYEYEEEEEEYEDDE